MKYCPACTAALSEETQSSCPTCHADPQAAIWRQVQPAYLRRRAIAALLDHALILWLLQRLFPPLWQSILAKLPTLKTLGAHLPIFQAALQGTLFLAYFFLFTWLWGTTPGKRIFKIRILRAKDGQSPSFTQTLLREVLGRTLCMLLSPIGYITAARKYGRARTFADLIANTVVTRPRKPT